MNIKGNFELVKLVDEYILVPIGETIDTFNGTVLFNDVSAFIWEKIEDGIDTASIVEMITDEFAVDKDTAQIDLEQTLTTMMAIGILDD